METVILNKHYFRTVTAILTLLLIITSISLVSCGKSSERTSDDTDSAETESGKLPAIFCNSQLYISDGYGSYGGIDVLLEGFTEYGTIKSVCADSELPDEELEGRGVTTDDKVYVSADNEYAIYVLSGDSLYRFLIATITNK